MTNVGLSDAGNYRVAVSDLSGTVQSALAVLDVDPTFTKITTDPLTTHKSTWHVGACADVDGNGYPDVFLSQITGEDFLYLNQGNFNFTQVTDPSPWDDPNNDGKQDLFLANCLSPNQLLYGQGGIFESITTLPAGECADSSGAAWGDFDGDGYPDLFVGNGAWAFAKHANSFYRNLAIEWTSGIVQELQNVPANQYLTITDPLRLGMPHPGELHLQCWKGMVCRVDLSPNSRACQSPGSGNTSFAWLGTAAARCVGRR